MHNIRAKTCTNNNKTELVIIKGGHSPTNQVSDNATELVKTILHPKETERI